MRYSFKSWLRRRGDPTPEADKLLPILVAAGEAGMNRKQIGDAVRLEPEILDELLDGLVRFGAVTVCYEAEGRTFRIRPGAAGLAVFGSLPGQ
jgi:hypothetical protein